jgi:hypothetical protein
MNAFVNLTTATVVFYSKARPVHVVILYGIFLIKKRKTRCVENI